MKSLDLVRSLMNMKISNMKMDVLLSDSNNLEKDNLSFSVGKNYPIVTMLNGYKNRICTVTTEGTPVIDDYCIVGITALFSLIQNFVDYCRDEIGMNKIRLVVVLTKEVVETEMGDSSTFGVFAWDEDKENREIIKKKYWNGQILSNKETITV